MMTQKVLSHPSFVSVFLSYLLLNDDGAVLRLRGFSAKMLLVVWEWGTHVPWHC